jgi:hypothetical protein
MFSQYMQCYMGVQNDFCFLGVFTFKKQRLSFWPHGTQLFGASGVLQMYFLMTSISQNEAKAFRAQSQPVTATTTGKLFQR